MIFLGISGVAGSGKDLFFKKLKKELSKINIAAERLAIADSLKSEINSITIPEYGINALSCTREEKETIRALLVEYGTSKRKQTKGRHWVDRLEKKIKTLKFKEPTVVCITDIRYSEYDKDELYWLKEELGGKLIHISQYSYGFGGLKEFKKPANSEEKRQDPDLKDKADYKLEWQFKNGPKTEMQEYTSEKAKEFLTWIQENEKEWLEKA